MVSGRRFAVGFAIGLAGALALVFLSVEGGWDYAVGAALMLICLIGCWVMAP